MNVRADWELAVVVGAGGLSVAVARRLAQRHRVLIVDLHGVRADQAAATIRAEGGDVSSLACDITDASAIARLIDAVQALGGFRVLVQVAGLSPSMGDFDEIMDVNLRGPALLADAFLPLVPVRGVGLFTASLAAHNYSPNEAVLDILREPHREDLSERLRAALGDDCAVPSTAYPLSKLGLLMLCRRAAVAWGARGARILSVSPGLIASPMGAREYANSQAKRRLFDLSPLKREGTMLEIADAVEFLVSDRASFISGTDLLVDGGLAGHLSEMPHSTPA